MDQKEKAYLHRRKVLDIIESHPLEMIEHPKQWMHNARLLLNALSHFKMYDEFEKEQQRIKQKIHGISEVKKTQNLNAEIYNTIHNSKLDMDIDRGLFKRSATYSDEAHGYFNTYKDQIDLNSMMVLYFNFSYAYFGNGEYQKSLKWINKLINENYGNVRLDAQCMARIMNIAIHFELGNYELIPSLTRSTNRFLTKVDRKFKVETSFLKFANRYLRDEYTPDLKSHFLDEIDKLSSICEVPFEKKAIEFFDLISWLRTKTENRTMEEIMSKLTVKETLSRGIM
jgi:tetratricopeptide (TPR) repeat protein